MVWYGMRLDEMRREEKMNGLVWFGMRLDEMKRE
jgi:hypothetical protein